MARTELFSRKQAGGVFAISGVDKHPGNVYFVHSGTGTNGVSNGQNPDAPFASIAYAFSSDVPVSGDVVYVLPGHTETVSAAGGITQDIAGVSVIGLGEGSARPRVTFGTVNGASWLISAANSTIKNIIGIGNKDGLTQPFDVTASDVTLDIEWRDTSDLIEAVAVVLATTVSRLKVNLKYRGFTTGNAAARPVNLVNVTGARIDLDTYGVVSVAWVNLTGTLSTDVSVTGRTYTSGITNGSRNVVDTIGSSIWYATVDDMSAGAKYSGGSGASGIASDDISSANSSIVSVGVAVSGLSSSAAVSSALSAAVSVGVVVASAATSAGASSATSAAVSVGVVVASAATSAAASSATSAAVSVGVVVASASTSASVSSATSAAVSVGAQATSIGTQADSIGTQATSVGTLTTSVGTQAASVGTQTTSVGTQTASVGTLVSAIGKPVGKASSLADNAIPNNGQAAGGLLATATAGDVYIEEIVFSKDGTNLTGPTSVEFSCDNIYGPNTAALILGSNVLAGFNANLTVRATTATVGMKPFVLESGKKLYIHGDDAAGTSVGNLRYSVIGRALTAGASIV